MVFSLAAVTPWSQFCSGNRRFLYGHFLAYIPNLFSYWQTTHFTDLSDTQMHVWKASPSLHQIPRLHTVCIAVIFFLFLSFCFYFLVLGLFTNAYVPVSRFYDHTIEQTPGVSQTVAGRVQKPVPKQINPHPLWSITTIAHFHDVCLLELVHLHNPIFTMYIHISIVKSIFITLQLHKSFPNTKKKKERKKKPCLLQTRKMP